MSKKRSPTIQTLIERSSFGAPDARAARARVPLAKGQEIAQAAQARAARRQRRQKKSPEIQG